MKNVMMILILSLLSACASTPKEWCEEDNRYEEFGSKTECIKHKYTMDAVEDAATEGAIMGVWMQNSITPKK